MFSRLLPSMASRSPSSSARNRSASSFVTACIRWSRHHARRDRIKVDENSMLSLLLSVISLYPMDSNINHGVYLGYPLNTCICGGEITEGGSCPPEWRLCTIPALKALLSSTFPAH